MATVAELGRWVEAEFPPGLAEPWDAIGLVCGRQTNIVRRVLIAVDVTPDVVQQAVDNDVDFLLAHHPLLFGGVTSVADDGYKGRLIHELIENRIALMVAHTNADSARPGVSDALATCLGVANLRALEPRDKDQMDKISVFVPHAQAQVVLNAMSEAGAGELGNYERCAYLIEGTGTFRPLRGAQPHIGAIGQVEQVPEIRIEMVAPRQARAQIVKALKQAHPYEEPAFDVVELVNPQHEYGLGRIGELPETMTLQDFATVVAQSLPPTNHGVRVAGRLDQQIRTVAVCGGSGDSLLKAANQADVFVTADLKHHAVSEHIDAGGCAVIDVAHFASEWPWCAQTAAALREWSAQQADTVEVIVSELTTDPWSAHVRSSD